jgi:hypothetical protein
MSQPNRKLSRRTLFAGVGTAGAIAAAATVVPQVVHRQAEAAPEPAPAPEKGGGYQLSEHVKRYYKTTLV